MATRLQPATADQAPAATVDNAAGKGTLASAMAAAFGEIEAATKSSDNPAFKSGGKVSKYADLTAIIEAIKPALIAHGLWFTQRPEPSDNGITIETVLVHASGDQMSLGKLFVPANKHDAQGFGSAMTYARRYALQTAFGVPVEDDDGNAASKPRNGALRQQLEDSVAQVDGMPDAEWARLVSLIEATGTDRAKLLKAYDVGDLRWLNQQQYAEVVDVLEKRLAAKVKAQTDKEVVHV